jgi:hypothetical protein
MTSLKPKSKNYRDTFKSEGLLLPSIQRHVMKKSLEPDEDRRSDVLHPSEIAKSSWCPRHDFYRVTGQYPENKKEMNSFRLESIFDYGHSVHNKWQTWLWEMGLLWGQWQCLDCKHVFFDTAPKHCPVCRSAILKYREIPIVDTDYMVAGHADGAVNDMLIEIKSIGVQSVRFEAPQLYDMYVEEQLTNDELWFRINRPFAAHIRQGMLYLHFIREMYGETWDKILFLYEWKANQDAKEFVIKYNRDLIDKSLVAMHTVVTAVHTNTPPDRPAWATYDHRTCKSCPVRNLCYGKDSTPVEETPAIRVVKADPKIRRRALQRR